MWCRDVQQSVDRWSMQWFSCHMIYSPETNEKLFKFNITRNHTTTIFFFENSSLSARWSLRPTRPSFFFLLHVASFLAGCWLLIFSNFWGAGPSLTPLPQADPSSFRSQAMPRFHVGHSNLKFFSRLKVTHMFSCKCMWIYFEHGVDAKNPNPTSALRDKLPGILLFYMWKCIKLIRFPRPAGQKK